MQSSTMLLPAHCFLASLQVFVQMIVLLFSGRILVILVLYLNPLLTFSTVLLCIRTIWCYDICFEKTKKLCFCIMKLYDHVPYLLIFFYLLHKKEMVGTFVACMNTCS